MKTVKRQTHESYILALWDLLIERAGKTDRAHLQKVKIVYGTGMSGVRGTTNYDMWQHEDDTNVVGDVIEICIFGEESPLQIAGTVIHEAGHVLARIKYGLDAGHGPGWKEECAKLGLPGAQAAGTQYEEHTGMFHPDMLAAIRAIPVPTDGRPGPGIAIAGFGFKAGKGGCKAGQGTKGGKSRGVGSGSRSKKIICPNEKCGWTCRAAQSWIDKGLPTCYCGSKMVVAVEKEEPEEPVN